MRLTLFLLLLAAVFAQADTQTDIEYARVGDTALLLDLHTPSNVKQPPLIVYVHGGAWRAGSKSDVPIAGLLDHGFAIASVSFPETAHDPLIVNARAKGRGVVRDLRRGRERG